MHTVLRWFLHKGLGSVIEDKPIELSMTFLIACPTSVLETSSAIAPAVFVTFSAVFCASLANCNRQN